jgi:hypothetical protein
MTQSYHRFSWFGEFSDQAVVDPIIAKPMRDLMMDNQPIEDTSEQIMCKVDPLGRWDDVPASLSSFAMVVSDKFKSVVESQAPGNVQFIPVLMKRRAKAVNCGQTYWIVNLLGRVPCVDMTKSVYKTISFLGVDQYRFLSVVINPDLIPKGAHIFTASDPVYGSRHGDYMSETLRRKLLEAKVTGIVWPRF